MTESFLDDPRPIETSSTDVSPPEASAAPIAGSDDPPRFGLVDVIEAFTAMRHEWRGNTRENRELAESMQGMAANLRQLEKRLLDRVGMVTNDDVASDLTRVIIEIDIHLTRALDATRSYEASQLRQRNEELAAVRASFDKLNFVARWFCRPFWEATVRTLEKDVRTDPASSPTVEGLTLLVARLHRMMRDQDIQRFDTLGLAFDGEKMHAIDSIESGTQPSGHVVEQLAPGYSWRGQLVRYAEVRVAN